MAGNVWEWQSELCSTSYVCRGGRSGISGSTYPICYRQNNVNGMNAATEMTGFRIVLYIM